jgi:GH24 family phage-related lysozyme (muramidase)
MKDEAANNIPIKIAIALSRLLEKNKALQTDTNKVSEIADSYNKICLNSGLRKATVSDIFNAKSTNVRASTLVLVLNGMNYRLQDFAIIYDSLNKADIELFLKQK